MRAGGGHASGGTALGKGHIGGGRDGRDGMQHPVTLRQTMDGHNGGIRQPGHLGHSGGTALGEGHIGGGRDGRDGMERLSPCLRGQSTPSTASGAPAPPAGPLMDLLLKKAKAEAVGPQPVES